MSAIPAVPVQVDSVVRGGGVVRCTYFCIDCQLPQPGWSIGLGNQSFPMFLLGVSGILLGPVSGERFTSPVQIEQLFDVIETVPGFSVEVNDIWIPSWIFRDRPPARGNILRIGTEMFRFAYQQREGWSADNPMWKEFHENWSVSVEEAEVFQEWERWTISVAKERYHENRDRALPWQKSDSDPDAPTLVPPWEPPPGPSGNIPAGTPTLPTPKGPTDKKKGGRR
jgi:hypothetical protein